MRRLLSTIVLCLPPVLALGQAAELKVNVTQNGVQAPETFQAPSVGARLVVTCSATVDCKATPPTAAQDGTPLALAPDGAARPKSFSAAILAAGTVTVTHGAASASTTVTATEGGPLRPNALLDGGAGGSRTTQTRSLQELIPAPPGCLAAALARVPTTPAYDKATRTARVAVTVLGAPLTPVPESIGEDDTLAVTVVGDSNLVNYVSARRRSPTRTVGGVAILGGDVQFPVTSLMAKGAEEKPRCAAVTFALGGFAPGRGEVEIVAVTSSGGELTLGKLELPVATLYSGMLSLGAIWSDVQDPRFKVGTNAGGSFVTREELGHWRLQYTLLYTPFIWGKRNFERSEPLRRSWYKHLNPTVGLVLNDVPNNGLVGVSLDFGSAFVVTYGVVASRVVHLDPNSGLTEGAAVTTASIPTTRRWDTGQFWAFSVDLRAAVQLLRTAIGSGSAD